MQSEPQPNTAAPHDSQEVVGTAQFCGAGHVVSRRPVYWYWWFSAISLFFLCVTWANFHLPQFNTGLLRIEDRSEGWRLFEPFNLARENNVAVWWSGISLLSAGLLAFQQLDGRGGLTRDAALFLAILVVGLSCDEICSVHERVGSTRDCLPFGAIGVLMLAYSLTGAFRRPATRHASILILIGFSLFGSVVFQEYLEHQIVWPTWLTGFRFAVEEGTELTGVFFVMCGMIRSEHDSIRLRWHEVLPDPRRIPAAWPLLVLGAVLHVGMAVTVLRRFDDLQTRGNPASWYPCVVYFWVATSLLWSTHKPIDAGSRPESPAAVDEGNAIGVAGSRLLFWCLMFCSLDAVAALSQYVPKLVPAIDRVIPVGLLEVTGCGRYVAHILLLICVTAPMAIRWQKKLALVALLAVSLIGCSLLSPSDQLALPAILAFAIAWILLR